MVTDEVSDELRELIRYLNEQIVSGTFTQELDNAVRSVKVNEERRHEYMVWYAHEMELLEEGKEQKTVEDIQRLINKLGYTEEQAMDFMDILTEEHSRYSLLMKEKATAFEP